jgi:hypothetical protein
MEPSFNTGSSNGGVERHWSWLSSRRRVKETDSPCAVAASRHTAIEKIAGNLLIITLVIKELRNYES